MTVTAVMDREGNIRKHAKPKKVTVTETVRVLLAQNSGRPVKLGDFTMYAVPSSGAPDSPPFYFVGQHKEIASLWVCHCKGARYRLSDDPRTDCSHITDAKEEKARV